jgi:hypothetical protein
VFADHPSELVATKLNRPIIDCKLGLNWADTLDLLSEFDTRRYRLQRRLIGPVYQTSNVRKFEQAVDEVIRQVVAKLRSLDGAEIDLKEWMHIIAVECLGAVVLSWSPGYIRDGSDGGTSTQSYLGWKRKSVFGLFPLVTKLSFFSRSLGRWFSNAWGVTFSTPRNFKPFFTVRRSSFCDIGPLTSIARIPKVFQEDRSSTTAAVDCQHQIEE